MKSDGLEARIQGSWRFLPSVLVGIAFSLSLLRLSAAPPNVLFIAIDDQNDWIGHLDIHPLAKTPHLDALAARGTTFLNAHANAPLCNPSRTSLLLGLRPSTTGIYGLFPWFRNLPELENRVTLPQHFAAQGYKTLGGGKIYHGGGVSGPLRIERKVFEERGAKNLPGGDIPKPYVKGLEVEFQVVGPRPGLGARPPQKLVPVSASGEHPLVDWGVWPPDNDDTQKGDYQVASWAVNQLKDLKKSGSEKPFFLATGFFLPHVPCYATQKWFDLYPDDDSILPPIRENDRDDTPRFSWYLHWRLPEPRLKSLQASGQWRNLVRSYLACTSFIDAQIGRILDALKENGLEENTIVVVWGDHGWHLGEKGITGKNTLWDPGTRVPLIFAGPGVCPKQRCEQPVELLDLYPTLIDLAGIEKRSDLDGLSLAPQLRDASVVRDRPAVTTQNQGNHAVRTLDWRYIHYADGSEELYDMKKDPHEWTNIAGDPAHASVIADLKKWLPKVNAPPASGSAQRVLTYDDRMDQAVWEGEVVHRSDPIPANP